MKWTAGETAILNVNGFAYDRAILAPFDGQLCTITDVGTSMCIVEFFDSTARHPYVVHNSQLTPLKTYTITLKRKHYDFP